MAAVSEGKSPLSNLMSSVGVLAKAIRDVCGAEGTSDIQNLLSGREISISQVDAFEGNKKLFTNYFSAKWGGTQEADGWAELIVDNISLMLRRMANLGEPVLEADQILDTVFDLAAISASTDVVKSRASSVNVNQWDAIEKLGEVLYRVYSSGSGDRGVSQIRALINGDLDIELLASAISQPTTITASTTEAKELDALSLDLLKMSQRQYSKPTLDDYKGALLLLGTAISNHKEYGSNGLKDQVNQGSLNERNIVVEEAVDVILSTDLTQPMKRAVLDFIRKEVPDDVKEILKRDSGVLTKECLELGSDGQASTEVSNNTRMLLDALIRSEEVGHTRGSSSKPKAITGEEVRPTTDMTSTTETLKRTEEDHAPALTPVIHEKEVTKTGLVQRLKRFAHTASPIILAGAGLLAAGMGEGSMAVQSMGFGGPLVAVGLIYGALSAAMGRFGKLGKEERASWRNFLNLNPDKIKFEDILKMGLACVVAFGLVTYGATTAPLFAYAFKVLVAYAATKGLKLILNDDKGWNFHPTTIGNLRRKVGQDLETQASELKNQLDAAKGVSEGSFSYDWNRVSLKPKLSLNELRELSKGNDNSFLTGFRWATALGIVGLSGAVILTGSLEPVSYLMENPQWIAALHAVGTAGLTGILSSIRSLADKGKAPAWLIGFADRCEFFDFGPVSAINKYYREEILSLVEQKKKAVADKSSTANRYYVDLADKYSELFS